MLIKALSSDLVGVAFGEMARNTDPLAAWKQIISEAPAGKQEQLRNLAYYAMVHGEDKVFTRSWLTPITPLWDETESPMPIKVQCKSCKSIGDGKFSFPELVDVLTET